MKKRLCDRCGKEISSKDKYIKCVEVGERKDNWVRVMNGVGDLCLKCWGEVKR